MTQDIGRRVAECRERRIREVEHFSGVIASLAQAGTTFSEMQEIIDRYRQHLLAELGRSSVSFSFADDLIGHILQDEINFVLQARFDWVSQAGARIGEARGRHRLPPRAV